MENRLYSGDQSLNVQLGHEIEREWQDLIEDERDTQAGLRK